VAHKLCRDLLATNGQEHLRLARQQSPAFRQVKLVLPHITFDVSQISLRVGKKTLTLMSLPGPCTDNIGVLVEEDRVLYAGDAFMPLPYVVGGDIEDTITSQTHWQDGLENVVQGHGDIVLRGEIDAVIKENDGYLSAIRKAVRQPRRKYPMELLKTVTIESCGKMPRAHWWAST
jgi:glyoxylase-like metal-dependent hydrolase (beta-lactamase superfamily II)